MHGRLTIIDHPNVLLFSWTLQRVTPQNLEPLAPVERQQFGYIWLK